MKIVLCSSFRDSTPYLPRYIDQVWDLWERLDGQHQFCCIWGEGDSTDDTRFRLYHSLRAWPVEVVDCTHGGQKFGSVVDAERFRQLAYMGKRIFSAIPDDADIVAYVESDLIWEPATLLALIERVGSTSSPTAAIAPMVFLRRDGWPVDPSAFYDVFAYRADGRHFTHYPPYHPTYVADKPFLVDSVGSCVVMRGEIARSLHFDEQTIFPDLCGQIRARGDSIYVDPAVACYHL